MAFDFSSWYDRHGHDSLAFDFNDELDPFRNYDVSLREGFDLIPMWLADMNFATAPSVMNALRKRLEHPILGYFEPTESYFDAVLNWHRTRDGFAELQKENLGFERSVLCGIQTALKALTKPGDRILMHSPAYVGFGYVLESAGVSAEYSPLYRDEAGVWRMDFADMERRLREHPIRAALLCSPHNPTGRVWERAELEELIALFAKYDVNVICDEIWSDLTRPGKTHIPLLHLNNEAKKRAIVFRSPNKTFNTGGILGAYYEVFSPELRRRYESQAPGAYFNDMDVLSMHTVIGAYSDEGASWADELRRTVAENVDFACDYIETHFDGVKVAKPESTYLLFLDCAGWCEKTGTDFRELLRRGFSVGVIWEDGELFGTPQTIRMNVALPRWKLAEALDRLDRYAFGAE